MVNKERYIGLGIDQDTAPDKRKSDVYWDAENIRVINNGRNLSITPIKDSALYKSIVSIPALEDKFIVGSIEVNSTLYLFLTSHTGAPEDPSLGSTKHALVSIDSTGTTNDLVSGADAATLQLSTLYPLEIVANYENDEVIKLYWTDGITLLKSINVYPFAIVGSPKVDIVQQIDLSQPTLTLQSGGNLIAGNIQYAYTLYNLNGTESLLSPLSSMLSVTENMKGYESGQSTGLSMSVTITIDTDFEYIKLYSIHYQELNQTPKITLVADEIITGSAFTFVDGGNVSIAELSESELTTLGNQPLIVGTLASKRNRLFIANYKSSNFDFDIDVRAFSHIVSTVYYKFVGDSSDRTNFTTELPEATHDCINFSYDSYKYIKNSASTYGATGPNLEISFTLSQLANATAAYNIPSLKKGEIYRFGIVFYNSYGQKTPAKWIADLKVPYGTTGSRHYKVIPRIQLTNGSAIATAAGATHYQLVMVERKAWDRTMVSQGFLVPQAKYKVVSGGALLSPYNHPFFGVKDIYSTSAAGMVMGQPYTATKDWTNNPVNEVEEVNSSMCFYSSDTLFESNLDSVDFIIPIGTNTLSSTNNYTRLLQLDTTGAVTTDNLYTSFKLDGYSTGGVQGSNLMDACDNGEILCAFFLKNYDGIGAEPTHTAISLAENSMFVKTGETKVLNGSVTLANTVQIPLLCNDSGGYAANYIHKFPSCILLNFSASSWHYNGGTAWDKFLSGGADSTRRIPIADLYRTLPNQYGGSSYEAKQRNEYLIIGALRVIDGTLNTETGVGDIYLSPLCINRCDPENYISDKYWNIYEYIKLDYIENNHNVFGRSDNMYEWSAGLTTNINYRFFRLEDNHKLLGAYNQKSDLVKAFSKPANFNTVDEFKNTVRASEEKFPNELIDSWLKFPVNDTKNLEGIYGPITKLYNFKSEIFAFQPKGVAILSINPRIQTQAVDGVNIELGIGAVLYDYKYLTNVSGTSTKFSVIDDGKMLFYYDNVNNTINVVEDDKISSLLGVRNILEANPLGYSYALYHRLYDEILFNFTGGGYFLVYNTVLKKFTSKYMYDTSFGGEMFIFKNKVLYRKGSNAGLWEKYASTVAKSSSITYWMCPASIFEKVFHNLEYRLKGQDFTSILVTNDINTSGTVTPNIENKFDIHRMFLPRVENSRERWRGIYIFVKLSNTSDFSLDDLVLMYNTKG